jgi:hypothetical protein
VSELCILSRPLVQSRRTATVSSHHSSNMLHQRTTLSRLVLPHVPLAPVMVEYFHWVAASVMPRHLSQTSAQLIRPPLLTTHAFSLFSRVSNATIICISEAVRSISKSTPECPPSETLAHMRQLSIHANHNEMSLRHARLLQESASQRG